MPVTIKESFAYRGSPSTWGLPPLKEALSPRTAVVFLCPAGWSAAFPHDHSQPIEKRVVETPDGPRPYLTTAWWTIVATLSGLPATIAPVGLTVADLPVGVQIVAPMWEDGTSIEFAAALSDAIGGFTVPPAFGD